MRRFVQFTLNGTPRVLQGRDALLPVTRYLRERERLTGTKIACGEGACGSCTVLVGTPNADTASAITYRTVNACLLAVYQIDGCHLVTIEGVTPADEALSPIQQAVVDSHGTQCGFCTPGIVLALTAAREAQQIAPTFAPDTLTGNLCRCTGYLGIREAAARIAALPRKRGIVAEPALSAPCAGGGRDGDTADAVSARNPGPDRFCPDHACRCH